MASMVTAGMTTEMIDAAMKQMDRPNSLRMLGLKFNRNMVTDISGLHPVTLYQSSTLSIETWRVPYLNQGAPGECCTGAYVARLAHKTVALKCFETHLTRGGAFCRHCDQLWVTASDDGTYTLVKEMATAWKRYAKGERRAMKNWEGMKDLQGYYSDEVKLVKDVLSGSKFELEAQWSGISFVNAQRTFLQEAAWRQRYCLRTQGDRGIRIGGRRKRKRTLRIIHMKCCACICVR